MKKKLFFPILTILISILSTLVFLEATFTLYFYITDKQLIAISDKLKSEENQYTPQGKSDCVFGDRIVPHPYFGYVYKQSGVCVSGQINSMGMMGQEYPLQKKTGEFNLLVIGGSVAEMYTSTKYLEEELNKHFTNHKIKFFHVLNGGIGAWKYPQQFLLFMLVANNIDGVISLDGFNEHFALENSSKRIEIPPLDTHLQNLDPTSGFYSPIALKLDSKLYGIEKNITLLKNSRFIYFMFSKIRGKLRYIATRGYPSLFFKFSPNSSSDFNKNYNFNQYLYYFRAMDAVAKKLGIKTAYFLQPVPLIKKKLTVEEKLLVGLDNNSFNPAPDYTRIYNEIEAKFLSLNQEGIKVYSLTDIYKNELTTVYRDLIHPNDYGFKILNQRVISVLKKDWKL